MSSITRSAPHAGMVGCCTACGWHCSRDGACTSCGELVSSALPYVVVGGTGRTVASFGTAWEAAQYAQLHPAYSVLVQS